MNDATTGRARAPEDNSDASASGLALFGWPALAAVIGAIGIGTWFDYPAIVLLASLVAGSGLVARGWAALSLVGVTYERKLTRLRAFPGDVVRIEARLDNGKPLPLSWVEVSESLPAALAPDDALIGPEGPDGRRALTFSTALGWYRSATLGRDLACRKRGYYRVGPARISSADVFGLFVNTREAAPEEILLVYPRLYPLADLGLPAHQPLGSARDQKRLFDDPSRPMGLRPYTPETPFKAVAWKATARSGSLQAKVYEPTVTQKSALFLAVDGFAGPEDEAAFELAISAVASLADNDLFNRRPVGVFANGMQADGSGAVVLPPGRAPDQRMLILDHLARLERAPSGDFAQFLEANLLAATGAATLVIVGRNFSARTMLLLGEQQRRGRPVLLLVAGDGPLPTGSVPVQRIQSLLQQQVAA